METLVLSSTYEPLHRVPWRRALTLWAAGRVEFLAEYEGQRVRSATRAYGVPAVVRFPRAPSGGRRELCFNRRNLWLRDKGRCQYCGRHLALEASTWDHVVPRAHGGPTHWENVVTACGPCNAAKGSRTPEQAGMSLMKAPERPRASTLWARLAEGTASVPEAWTPFLGFGSR